MKKIMILVIILFSINIYSQCNPLEVAVYMSEKDGWMFPYSAFYWGMSDGLQEIQQTNLDCIEKLQDNEECIMNCLYLTESEVDAYLGRVGCIFYNCVNGEDLTQNYEEYNERPVHLYGQYYCSGDTSWNEELDLCESNVCNGDMNGNNVKNVQDIVIIVQEILNNENLCD